MLTEKDVQEISEMIKYISAETIKEQSESIARNYANGIERDKREQVIKSK